MGARARTTRQPESVPPCSGSSPAAAPDCRFEAAIVDWDETLASDGRHDARRFRQCVEALCGAGFDIALVSLAHIEDIDSQLAARPSGPGRLYLYLCLEASLEVFEVVPDGPVLASRRAATVAEKSDAVRWALLEFEHRGIATHRVLVCGDDIVLALEDQLHRRERGELPVLDEDPVWTLAIEGLDPTLERGHEVLLTMVDGYIGSSAALLVDHPAASPQVLVGGVYDGEGSESHLLHGPVWTRIPGQPEAVGRPRRVLDLRSGLLGEEVCFPDGQLLRSVRFSSAPRPGTVVLRAEGPHSRIVRGRPLTPPAGRKRSRRGHERGRHWVQVNATRGGVTAAASDRLREDHDTCRIDRLAAYLAGSDFAPPPESAVDRLRMAEAAGFERLFYEHRAAWGERWSDADVRIEGDPQLQQAVRFALFHLMASVTEREETALGARGLTGSGYRGHVFWDTDVFVLPFLAATRPRAARSLLEYRLRRLVAARREARSVGRAGARFPWESARSGRDVTPSHAHLRSGEVIPIRTGEQEEHVVADVAWSAACYVDWTGDETFRDGPGLALLIETARYWTSRILLDSEGRGHIRGVIGPDEYHETVDDNAFTNVMARWNLRRAAKAVALADGNSVGEAEQASWLALANALVDGYDPVTGIYEQFTGFFNLEPLVIEEMVPRRPVAAELLLGRERLQAAQVVKQADVLMLHHLVPEEVAPGSLRPNLLFYEPRTAHASSLSPGIHASLFARAGMTAEAVEALTLTSRIDLDDLTQTTAAGLHLAAMGSLWQALAFGFLGLRPAGSCLRVDPRLPESWGSLEMLLRFRGARTVVRAEPDALTIVGDPAVHVLVGSRTTPVLASPSGLRLARRGRSWKEVRT